jgi:hypothetical protein
MNHLSELTRTPVAAHSTASEVAMCFTASVVISVSDLYQHAIYMPALEALYGVWNCRERKTCSLTELNNILDPPVADWQPEISVHDSKWIKAKKRTWALMLAIMIILPPPVLAMLRAASRAVKNAPWTLIS